MRKSRKSGIALLFIIILMQLIGCSRKPEESVQTQKPEEEYIYVAEFHSLDVENGNIVNALIGEGGIVYGVSGSDDGSFQLCSLKIGEETMKEIPLDVEEGITVSGLGKDSEGNILLGLTGHAQNEEAKLDFVGINKVTPEGTVVETIDATAALAQVKDFFFSNILTDSEGNYYVAASHGIYVLNPSGDVICEINAGNYISNMFRIKDGRIIAAYFGSTGWQLQEVSLSQKKLVPVESSIKFDYGTYSSGMDTDILYTQDTMLYTANLEDESPARVLNWVDSDISSNNLQDCKILEDGRIAALTIEWGSEDSTVELAVLTKKLRSEVPEKKVLTYGALYLPYFSNQDIVAFNKQSEEYRIEIKEYGDDNTDMETKISMLTADIASGNGPDIIDMFYNYIPLEDYLNMGVLEDLNPYLEKDAELKKDNFVESVIDAYEKDGKLYSIMSGFGIRTIAGKVSDVGSGANWTIDDMIKLVDTKPEDIEIIPYSNKSSVLNLMCSMNIDAFVNSETGVCNFESEEFKKLLEFADRFPKEMKYDANGPSDIEKIRNGQLLLLDTTLTSVQLFQMHEYMFGEEINYIGYPTIKESGTTVTPFGTTVAMNSQSENKDGVWEFIRFNLTEDRQKKMQSYSGSFPISKTALDTKLQEDMTPEYYEDVNGEQKEQSKAVWGQGDFDVEVFAATAEQVERVKELINTAGNSKNSDSQIQNIINEEAQAYFEGQRSVEDVAALIQSRVQVYVNESR